MTHAGLGVFRVVLWSLSLVGSKSFSRRNKKDRNRYTSRKNYKEKIDKLKFLNTVVINKSKIKVLPPELQLSLEKL